jgi:hypothetical protein
MWTWVDEEKIVYIKGPGGFPWDWYQYNNPNDNSLPWDQQRIRILMTENVWSNPATAKIDYKDGIDRFPRYIDWSPYQLGPAQIQFQLGLPRTCYLIINANGTSTSSDNGVVACTFSGPYYGPDVKDAKGNILIPAGNDWKHTYNWKGNTETILHRAPVGRYSWTLTDKNGVVQASSIGVGIVNQPCPTPVQKLW